MFLSLQDNLNIQYLMSKYQGGVDPIQQLRNCYNKNVQKKTKIKLKGNELYFDKDIRLNLKTETAWQSTSTDKQYNLGSLWLFMEFHSKNIPDKASYFQKVSEAKVDPVNIADQEEIIKYMTGEINNTLCINQQLKMAISKKGNRRDQPVSGFENMDDQTHKKVKSDLPYELQVLQHLFAYERPVNSRSKCLRYPNKTFQKIINDLSQRDKNKQNEQTTKNGKPKIASFYEKKKIPIIIVPQNIQGGNLSIHNIEKFLAEGDYNEQIRHENPYIAKLQFQYRLRNKNILFEVVNNPALLSEDEWQYVVAIFVSGDSNQFEGATVNMKNVFEKCKGYFLKYFGSKYDCKQDWNVKTLVINRNVRYGDKQIIKTIWGDIESWLFQRV